MSTWSNYVLYEDVGSSRIDGEWHPPSPQSGIPHPWISVRVECRGTLVWLQLSVHQAELLHMLLGQCLEDHRRATLGGEVGHE